MSALRLLGHRPIRGPNLYHNEPVWYAVLEGEGQPDDIGGKFGAAAVRLQQAAGLTAGFHASWRDQDGDVVVVYDYDNEEAGRVAGRAAVRLLDGSDEARLVARIKEAAEENAPAPEQRLLLEAAKARGIPVLKRGTDHFQLGWGDRQEHLWGTVTGRASGLGFEIANDHERILEVLDDTGIRIPLGEARRTLAGVRELAEELRYPVAIKPLRGRGGVTVGIEDESGLEAAYDKAKQLHSWVVVEDHISGDPYRVLVADGVVVAATRRTDGEDVTDILHPGVQLVAERAARLVGIDLVGVDIVTSDISVPFEESRGAIVSLDPRPDLTIHADRDIANPIIARLFPEGNGRIPLAAVTGTNGKTTTIRLISHILKYGGGRVGMACTGAVEVDNQVVLKGDYSGPAAAQSVLREPGVTHAVCEVARGGILRRGLGFDKCDVGVFLNVASDHLGQGGIETLEDLTRLKGTVIRSVSRDGTAVLNADDELVWSQREGLACKLIPFTMDPTHPEVAAHLAADPENVAITLVDDEIVLRRGPAQFRIAAAIDIPITLEGAARFNIQNAMAATAVGYALGVSEEDVRAGLVTFNPSMGQLPGRMNLIDLGGVRVLVDYGHNVPALTALAEALPRLARGRRINVANASGNRRDEDLTAFGATIAKMYDKIYLCDPDPRRREPGATARVIEAGIKGAGFPEDKLAFILEEEKATRQALAESRPGDLVVLQADDIDGVIGLCRDLQQRLDAGESPGDLNEWLLAA